jgi:hypothetical protein
MRVGEISKFWIHHDYAYGKFGCPPRIPPGRIGIKIKMRPAPLVHRL